MSSRVLRDVSVVQRARLATLTPDQRIALAIRMGEEGLSSFMTTHGVDRPTAIARIAATRRAGRRRSKSADLDDR